MRFPRVSGTYLTLHILSFFFNFANVYEVEPSSVPDKNFSGNCVSIHGLHFNIFERLLRKMVRQTNHLPVEQKSKARCPDVTAGMLTHV